VSLWGKYPVTGSVVIAALWTLAWVFLMAITQAQPAPTASELAGQRAVIQQNAEAWVRDMDLHTIAMVCASPPAGHCDVTVRAREDSSVFLVSLRCDAHACRIAP